MRTAFLSAALLLSALAAAAPARAHNLPFSYMDLSLGDGGADATYSAHAVDWAYELNLSTSAVLLQRETLQVHRAAMADILGRKLRLFVDGVPVAAKVLEVKPADDKHSVVLKLRYDWTGRAGMVRLERDLFDFDKRHELFVNVLEDGNVAFQEILKDERRSMDYYSGTRQGVWSAFKRFFLSGMHHIFIGPDHILFILGLLFAGGGVKRLLTIVTSFTLAHSVTLSLAALDLVRVPARPVDVLVAASVAYIGLENLMMRAGRWKDHRPLISFGFGFIHGFGFAAVLRDFGLPRQSLAMSLFSFNVGVEAAQACIVAGTAPLLALLRARRPAWADKVTVAGSWGIVLAGLYWMGLRLFGGVM